MTVTASRCITSYYTDGLIPDVSYKSSDPVHRTSSDSLDFLENAKIEKSIVVFVFPHMVNNSQKMVNTH